MERFAARFGCRVIDGYGSSEGGVNIRRRRRRRPARSAGAIRGARHRHPRSRDRRGVPAGALRRRRPPAQRRGGDRRDREPGGAGGFEGYYNNPEADAERTRGGRVLDRRPRLPRRGRLLLLRRPRRRLAARRRRELRRRAGRGDPRRHPGVRASRPSTRCPTSEAGDAGDGGARCSATGAAPSIADGVRGVPRRAARPRAPSGRRRYVRVAEALPSTATQKVLKRQLRSERWDCADPVWWRPTRTEPYRRLTDDDRTDLRARFAARDRLYLIG